MRQKSFSSGFEKHTKQTRKEKFLGEMDQVIPWKELTQGLEPYYSNPRGAGRRPKGLERMPRIYFLQHGYLSDPAMEEALYDSRVLREFAGIDLGNEPTPDESTILQFRHLMEARDFGAELIRLVNAYLAENGLVVARGTIVDATFIPAPSSMKNQEKARDPEMQQTKKGNQRYFGMKAHMGVDSQTKLVHSAAVTASGIEMPIRIRQGALSRPSQERQSRVGGVRIGEHRAGEAAPVTVGTGLVRPQVAERP